MELLRTIAPVSQHYAARGAELSVNPPNRRTSLKAISNIEQLCEYSSELEDLSKDLAVQNVSYEPWILCPILNASARNRKFLFLLLFDSASEGKSRLIGFFPFERVALHPLVPLSCLRLWADPFNYLNARCDPLVRKGHDYCVDVLLDWFLREKRQADVLNLRGLTDGTSIVRSLTASLSDKTRLEHIESTIESHLYRRHVTADSYINAVLSKKSQQTLRRYERRLRDLGTVEYADLDECPDVERLIDEFIALEDEGWKGKQGVSIAAYGHREWVKRLLLDAHNRQRLSLLTIRVDGKLIAARCVLVAKPGSFLFKLTYDEEGIYAKRSPGLLLEFEAIRRMHSDHTVLGKEIDWLDTCSSPHSPIFSRSRSEGLKIRRFVIARSGGIAALAIAMSPSMAWASQAVIGCTRWLQRKIKALTS